jgi:ATP synthase protein I
MSDPDGSTKGDLERLDERLGALESARRPRPGAPGIGEGAQSGYQLLGQMLGGVLGGLGFGWLVDRFAHTAPWGLVGGLLIGAALSVYGAVRTASQISARAEAKSSNAAASGVGDAEGD